MQDSTKCDELRSAFENREAIYIEQGVLRVRVTDIRFNVDNRQIHADVEEIPTAGLEQSLFHQRSNAPSPIRWKICAGYLTSFSEHTWEMGYGGWSLHFAPEVVAEFVAFASNWPAALNAYERYNLALSFVSSKDPVATAKKRAFSDSTTKPEG